MLWVIINKDKKRPCRADEFGNKLGLCNEFVFGNHTKSTFSRPKEKFTQTTYTTNYADVDQNDHVNNKSYIRIAEMTAPENFIQTHKLKKMKVKFIKESFLNDVLTCITYTTETPNNYLHKITKDSISVCDIETLWEEKTAETSILDYNLTLSNQQ